MSFEKNKKIIVFVSALILLIALPVLAAPYTFLEPLPGVDATLNENVLTKYLEWLFTFALALAAVLAVIKIIIGAMYIIVGGASEGSQTEGREMIKMAIWGLLLAISSVLLLTTINPALVTDGLIIPPIKVQKYKGATGGVYGGDVSVNSRTKDAGTPCADVKKTPDGQTRCTTSPCKPGKNHGAGEAYLCRPDQNCCFMLDEEVFQYDLK